LQILRGERLVFFSFGYAVTCVKIEKTKHERSENYKENAAPLHYVRDCPAKDEYIVGDKFFLFCDHCESKKVFRKQIESESLFLMDSLKISRQMEAVKSCNALR